MPPRPVFKDPQPKAITRSRTPFRENETWVQRYAPHNRKDIAVNDRKIEDVARSLTPNSQTRALLLSGPAGSGKSSLLYILAQEQNLDVKEFHPPNSLIGATSVMESFRDFLTGASVFDRKSSLILIEELPNVFHEGTRQEFESALLDWVSEPDLPIVAISFTEIEINAKYSEALLVPRILGQLVQDSFCVHIKINPPSATLLKKTISSVAHEESAHVSPAITKELSECGDVRNGLIALEMYCRTGSSGPGGSLWVRDTPTELFHAIGKVVWTSKKKNSLEEALERFDDTMDFFNLTILENYTSAKHQRLPVGEAANVTDWLSLVDVAPSLSKLGALASAHEIEQAHEDSSLPKRFVPTKLTQFMRWRRTQYETESKIRINLKNRRLYSSYVYTPNSLVLDEFGYASNFRRPTPDLDDRDDDDDDFDFDTFA